MKRFFAVLMLFMFVQSQLFAATIIPQGTLIVVQPQKLIDADDVRAGDTVKFSIIEPVKVNDNIVIKSGNEVIGRITKRKNNGILGIPGKLEIGEFYILTQNNELIRLTGSISDEGENRYWANVGWIFVFPLLFIKGNDGKIQSNSTYMLRTAEDTSF